MRIREIRETAIPLKSSLRNAVFDFSEMTTSVVAVITDVIRDGKPVTGFGFNSTGRYACGAQMRERFIPRLLKAPPESLLNETGDNLDPEKILACMMQREKPGGHSERSVAIGTIEVAVWDAVAKVADKPLHRVLAERYSGGNVPDKVPCYVGGGNQMTLAIVGGFGLGGCEAYPGVFGVFAGFADDAKVENGYLELPDRPGIGFEGQNALFAVMRELAAR